MSDERIDDKPKSRVKELVSRINSMSETSSEGKLVRPKGIKNSKVNWIKDEEKISIIQTRNHKDDLSKFDKIPFKNIQLGKVDEKQNFFNFRFNIHMPKSQKNNKFSQLKKIELTLEEKEKIGQTNEAASISEDSVSKSSLTTDSRTSMTDLDESIKNRYSNISKEENGKKRTSIDIQEDQQTVIELPSGLDGDSDNEQIDDYYSSDFFKKRNEQDVDEETLADDKDTDTVITTYNMSQVIEQKASILITQSSSSDSCVESKDPKIKIKKGGSPARRELRKKISNDLQGSYFQPMKSQLIDESEEKVSFYAPGYEFDKNSSNYLPESYSQPMKSQLIDESQEKESFYAPGYEFDKNSSNDPPGSYFQPMKSQLIDESEEKVSFYAPGYEFDKNSSNYLPESYSQPMKSQLIDESEEKESFYAPGYEFDKNSSNYLLESYSQPMKSQLIVESEEKESFYAPGYEFDKNLSNDLPGSYFQPMKSQLIVESEEKESFYPSSYESRKKPFSEYLGTNFETNEFQEKESFYAPGYEFDKNSSNDLPGSYYQPVKSQLIVESEEKESFYPSSYESREKPSSEYLQKNYQTLNRQLIDELEDNEFTYESDASKQFEKDEQLSKKIDKNGKIYYEIICPEYENKDKEVREQTEFLIAEQQDEQGVEEKKIFFLSHVDTSNAKGKFENFEYLSEEDNYIKYCPNDDDPKPKPTPKVTINLFKDIKSVDKRYSYNQEQDNNDSATNIIDIPKIMSHYYDASRNEVGWSADKNWTFLDDTNKIVCLTECLKSNITAIKNGSKKFVLFCSEIFDADKSGICFEQVFEYVSVKFENSDSQEDISKKIKKKIDHLDSLTESNMNIFHPIEYAKENLIERKSSNFLRNHSLPGVRRDILLGFEDDQNTDKINWKFQNSLLTNLLIKTLAQNKQKLFIILVKAKEKCLRFDQILRRSKLPCDIYDHKEFQHNNESRVVTHLSFTGLLTEQEFKKENQQYFSVSDRQKFQQIDDKIKTVKKAKLVSDLSISVLENVNIEPSSQSHAENIQFIKNSSPEYFHFNQSIASSIADSTPNDNFQNSNEYDATYEEDDFFDDFSTQKPSSTPFSESRHKDLYSFQMNISSSFDSDKKVPSFESKLNQNRNQNEITKSNQDLATIESTEAWKELKSPLSPRRFLEMDKRCEKSTPTNLLSREQLQKQKKYSAVLEQSEKIQNLKKMIQSIHHRTKNF